MKLSEDCSILLEVSAEDIQADGTFECPEGTTTIGNQVFSYCTSLKKVRLPVGLTTIGNGAFFGCSGLNDVVLPEGLTMIGSRAFYGCTGLKKVTLPESLTNISDHAFYGCTGLKKITLPESLTTISEHAFYGCTGLKEVSLSKSLTTIGSYAFYGCTGLTEVTLPKSLTIIGSYAFYGCIGLKEVTLPKSLIRVDNNAFSNCRGLKEVTLPEDLTTIDNFVFAGCRNLKEVTLPKGFTTINYFAFSGCTSLTEVTLSENLTSIRHNLFDDCKSLETLYIEASTVEKYQQVRALLLPYLQAKVVSYEDAQFIKELNARKKRECHPSNPPFFDSNSYEVLFSMPDELIGHIHLFDEKLIEAIKETLNAVPLPEERNNQSLNAYRTALTEAVSSLRDTYNQRAIFTLLAFKLEKYCERLKGLILKKKEKFPTFFDSNPDLNYEKEFELRTVEKLIKFFREDTSITFYDREIELLGQGFKGDLLNKNRFLLENLPKAQPAITEFGNSESSRNWDEILISFRRRALTRSPKLAIGDGALGFWNVVNKVYPACSSTVGCTK